MPTTATTPTIADLRELATKAGWTKTATRLGREYYRDAKGGKAWLDAGQNMASAGFWFLVQQSRFV